MSPLNSLSPSNSLDICANDIFRNSWKDSGVVPTAFEAPHYGSGPATGGTAVQAATPDQEALIQSITDRVVQALQGSK